MNNSKEKALSATLGVFKAIGVFKDDIRQIKLKLEFIDEDSYYGALVRARCDQTIVPERPTKRALGLEKAYDRRNHIAEIECNGIISGGTSTLNMLSSSIIK